MKFKIDPEFQSYLPRLSEEEYAGLKLLIETDGHVDPLVLGRIGKELILLDGHNRHQICEELKLPFPTREIVFPTRELAIEWIIDCQLGRRNLTDERRDYYRGKKRLRTNQGPGNPQLCHSDTIGQ